MTTFLKLILLPFILFVLSVWVTHHMVETFLDDLGGPDEGGGYA